MSVYQDRPHRCGGFCGGCAVVVETPGIQGPKGDKGDKGDPGATPDISAEAKTLPEGSEATVERSGTQTEPVFTFGIPKGDKGEQGERGVPGKDAEIVAVSDSFIDNLF